MRKIIAASMLSVIGLILVQALVIAQAPANGRAPRAIPPKTWDRDVESFFASSAQSHLVGERPVFGVKGGSVAAVRPGPAGGEVQPAAADGGAFAWSKIISADVLVNEVKAQQPVIGQQIANLGEFKGGGYKKLRVAFSMLAVSMGIINEFDGDVRWKDQAPAARDGFARAGQNTKVATDASFNESKLRAQDLEGMIRGESVNFGEAEATPPWNKVAARTPLMNRLEVAHQEQLSVLTANQGDFDKNLDQVAHEAQIIAALAEIIQREGYEYAEDETYKEYSEAMKSSALEVVEGVKLKDYDKARKAVSAIGQSCTSCHGDFRS